MSVHVVSHPTVARFRIVGGAVEAPSGLWHIAKSGNSTYCEQDCSEWPHVARAVERFGIWCGVCLMGAAGVRGAP